jgi:hypothetical protein
MLVETLMRWILRLLLTLLGMLLLVGMLAALVLYVVYASVRWLLTGRKPQLAIVWQQYQGMRQRFQSGAGPASSDVIDVEAREVREDLVGRNAPRESP